MSDADAALLRMVKHLEGLALTAPALEEAIHSRDVPGVYAVETLRAPHTRGFSGARTELLLHGSPTAIIAPHLERMRVLSGTERASLQLLDFFKADVATARDRWPQWLSQSLANAPALSETPSASALRGIFDGRPAVLVSGGPSLEKNLSQLSGFADRIVVIAVNRVVPMLIEREIRADITVATESLERLVSKHLANASAEGTPTLVGRPSLHPSFFDVPCERRFLMSDHSPHELFLADLAQVELPTFPAASVAHVGLQLAAFMGCSDVVLIGQDLALQDGALYGQGDPDKAAGEGHTSDTLTVPGYHGGEVTTTPVLATFLRSFEVLVDQLSGKTRVWNATEGGAAIRGAEAVPLAELLERLAGDDLNVQAHLAEAHERASTGDGVALETGLRSARAHLETALAECDGATSLDDLRAAMAPIRDLIDPALLPLWVEALAPLYASGTAPDPSEIVGASAAAIARAAREVLDRL
jgi:hypothetical protein